MIPARRLLVALAVALPFCAGPAAAWDWHDEPVGFRISLALDRASTFTDVAARAATTAYPFGSSTNPSADDFLREPPYDFRLAGTATGSAVAFANGSLVTAEAGSAAYRLPAGGTLTAIFARTDSQGVESRQGDHFSLRSNELTLRYGHRLTPALSLGAAVRLSESTLGLRDLFRIPDFGLDFPQRANVDSHGVDVTLGVLAAASPHWLFGLTFGAGWTHSVTEATVFFPPPPFGVDRVDITLRDDTRSTSVRAGVGWRPAETFEAYADVQYLHLDNHDQGAVDVGRLFLGLEILPIKALALRVGGSLDTAGAATLSAGLGIYASKRVQGELAYVYNAFPEVRREFGRAHLVSASLVVAF